MWGDMQNEEAFFREQYAALLAVARQRGPWHMAEEIVLQTLVKYDTQLKNGVNIRNPEAYLHTILIRTLGEVVEKERKHRRHTVPAESAGDELKHTETPEKVMIDREYRDLVRRGFAELDAECQQLLCEKIIEGKSYYLLEKEMAASRSTLQRRCQHCLKQFAAILNKSETIR